MTATPYVSGGNDSVVVSVILGPEHAAALDDFCGRTLSSRAAAMRRFLVEAMRRESLLPDPASSRRQKQGAR